MDQVCLSQAGDGLTHHRDFIEKGWSSDFIFTKLKEAVLGVGFAYAHTIGSMVATEATIYSPSHLRKKNEATHVA